MKQALLLLNMGGPNSIEEVELFLRNMFADKRILPVNPYLRKFIANRIIAKRIDEVKENYRLLGGASPLPAITDNLIEKLKQRVAMPVYAAMRYVPPFAQEALVRCKEEGVDELILFPMYPQYSTTTTLSSVEDIAQQCKVLGYTPTIRVIDPYYDDYDYIEACGEKILEAVEGEKSEEYDLLLSAHGLPMSIIKAGDPYEKQVEGNVSAIKTWLTSKGINFHDIKLVYQSKVGKSAWLEPNLADVLRNPTHRKVLIYPLAFTIDNSETVFELDIEHREIAKKLKYADYRIAKCFNDDERFVDIIVRRVV
ncbi:Ferrochelatase, protoheme ferro-lyase [hydrothermal vent metagenome]|uniref:Ferrochelatase, protoheme ferro-lyase n=1 Tax=hydrothermal vent metagenome TaxID=652676 RepID=A0A1W1E7G7_9ZZZZ